MIKGQAFCQSLFSTWFCGRGSFCHHESEIEVVGMIKGQAFCQSLFSTWFCGRGSFCHHESEIEVVGELAEFCRKADFLPYRFTCG